MRCVQCGWVAGEEGCPCGVTPARKGHVLVPLGTRVLARPGRGASMQRWDPGEVTAHQGPLHQVTLRFDEYWCEPDDLLPDSAERAAALVIDCRVWARWLDARWYTGRVDGVQGPLRHVSWDDGDSMWLATAHIVPLVREAETPQVGCTVVARRWNGDYEPARVEQKEGLKYLVMFADEEETWLTEEELRTFPPNPFRD